MTSFWPLKVTNGFDADKGENETLEIGWKFRVKDILVKSYENLGSRIS
jgi:hypothetical protein